jgi:hypothetical protein
MLQAQIVLRKKHSSLYLGLLTSSSGLWNSNILIVVLPSGSGPWNSKRHILCILLNFIQDIEFELMWKEIVVIFFRYYPDICPEGLMENVKIFT